MLNYYKHFPPSHRRGQTTIQSCNSCNSQTLTTVFLSTCCSVMDVLQLAHRALIRYSARLILAWEPVMVTCLSVEPSTGLAILIWAPDIWRISLIFAPWRPMMQPMSWGRKRLWKHVCNRQDTKTINTINKQMRLTSFGMVSSWEPVCAEASIPAEEIQRNPMSVLTRRIVTNLQQSHSLFLSVHLPWKPWLLCAMGKGLCCMASWWSLVSCW